MARNMVAGPSASRTSQARSLADMGQHGHDQSRSTAFRGYVEAIEALGQASKARQGAQSAMRAALAAAERAGLSAAAYSSE